MATMSAKEPGETVSIVLPAKQGRIDWLISAVLAIIVAILDCRDKSGHVRTVHDLLGSKDYVFLLLPLILVMRAFWLAFARLIVTISSTDLKLTSRGLGLHWTKTYSLGGISNLRVGRQRIFTYRPWLAFERRGKTKFIGRQLAEAADQQLLKPVYVRFPHLAPLNVAESDHLYRHTATREQE